MRSPREGGLIVDLKVRADPRLDRNGGPCVFTAMTHALPSPTGVTRISKVALAPYLLLGSYPLTKVWHIHMKAMLVVMERGVREAAATELEGGS